ncbi:hypothetical protein Pcinc_002130 [Petrolisthes cinctipes]|uniref:DUF7041 domain-containing protein n=1 Tax=Petrolisthes cinctipes TaxID=88211 RepID=A0AAE1L3V6_PETCI|nr:hypothetical protein Pcinc_002130 [Petrolisthes cinctipes]
MANQGISTPPSSGENSTNSITIKPPQFSESSARGWFAVLEVKFKLKGITVSSTKFYNALSALPPNLVTNILSDVINNECFDDLEKTVIQSYEQTKPEIFEKLAQRTTMTGRPSLYLLELQSPARRVGIGDCQDLIRHKFLSSLPHTISPAVAAQTSLSLTQLCTLADELMPMHNNFCNFTQNKQVSRSSPERFQERLNTTTATPPYLITHPPPTSYTTPAHSLNLISQVHATLYLSHIHRRVPSHIPPTLSHLNPNLLFPHHVHLPLPHLTPFTPPPSPPPRSPSPTHTSPYPIHPTPTTFTPNSTNTYATRSYSYHL